MSKEVHARLLRIEEECTKHGTVEDKRIEEIVKEMDSSFPFAVGQRLL